MQLRTRALHASVLAAVVGCGSAQALAHAAGLPVGPADLWPLLLMPFAAP